MRGVGEEGRVRGEVVALELLHQVRHLRRRRREGRCCGLRHRGGIGAGGGHSRGNRSVGLFELGGAREVVVGWWPLDRRMDGSDRRRLITVQEKLESRLSCEKGDTDRTVLK